MERQGEAAGEGFEARGNQHSLQHPCAAFVLVMHGSHFDLQPSLFVEIEDSEKSYVCEIVTDCL